ncbi:hypothetical protein IJ579_03265 [bacterium]|nr:hypothetical protein [bacterium]
MDNSRKNNVSNDFFSSSTGSVNSANPFNASFNAGEQKIQTVKRLNGYDSTILNKNAFDENESKGLSLDYRIKEKESSIKELDSRIKVADNYGASNETLGLKAKRNRLLEELNSLKRQQLYAGRVLGEEFSHESLKTRMPVIYKIQDFISRQILARLSKKIHSIITLSDSLEKLSDINRSVNELMDMNVPYGEKVQNYERLTEYLNQASVIHSRISRSLGKRG